MSPLETALLLPHGVPAVALVPDQPAVPPDAECKPAQCTGWFGPSIRGRRKRGSRSHLSAATMATSCDPHRVNRPGGMHDEDAAWFERGRRASMKESTVRSRGDGRILPGCAASQGWIGSVHDRDQRTLELRAGKPYPRRSQQNRAAGGPTRPPLGRYIGEVQCLFPGEFFFDFPPA